MLSEVVMIRGRRFTVVADPSGVAEAHGDHPNMVARLVKVFDASGKVEWQRKS